jgi:2-hydroxy-6-oxonona-2,4-dienedioate hydrolase
VPHAGGRRAAAAAGFVWAGLCALAVRRYRRDLRRARERVAVGGTVVETPYGAIEFGSEGDGIPVLVVHGAGGGFDQGLEIAKPLARGGLRLIAMSRFGYLKTPLPPDASPEAQADAHAGLLDALGIQRAAVVGASAGAPSSMQFALRHPDRTGALVLLVPLAYPAGVESRRRGAAPSRISPAGKFLFDAALKSDFLFWAASGVARDAMMRAVLGTPPSALRNASAEERQRVARVLDHIQPLSMRRLGLLNDAAIARSLPRYDLERIAAPTLVIGVADCLYGTYAGARHSAEHIPGARFVSYAKGGHLWAGHQPEVMDEIAGFLRRAAAGAAS